MLWLFSDKKNFDQNQKVNQKNGYVSGNVMILGIMSNEGDVMPLSSGFKAQSCTL